jgi:type II secretory pathway component GspD/PulD (secretin)
VRNVRHIGARLVVLAPALFAASAARAQETPKSADPKPAPAPAAAPKPAQEGKPAPDAKPNEPPKDYEFVGADGIRTPAGKVVRYYHVNYVDAAVLAKELNKWATCPTAVTAEGPAYVAMPVGVEKCKTAPAVPSATTMLRIEETEERWPVLSRVLELYDTPQGEVYVEAKIVELSYGDDLHYGVEMHLKRPLGDTFFTGTDIKFPNRIDAVNQFTTAFHEAGKDYTFDAIIDLAENGAKTTLTSKPGVYVTQSEVARIRVGDNEPIVQQQISGTSVTATTIFKDTGITLEVQPLLIGHDAVRARISAEASRVSSFRVTATSSDLQVVNPVISTRNADTVVTVPDGETLVIGGLDQDFDQESRTGIPLLMDIPLVGHLFGSTTKTKNHTELVFFLKFTILPPNEAREVKPPAEKERTKTSVEK